MGYAEIAAIIAALIGAAGTGAAVQANNRQIEAQAEAQRADRFRQAELQRQADDAMRREVAKFGDTEGQNQNIERAVAERTAATVQPQAAPPAQYQSSSVAAPVEIKGDLDRRLTSEQSQAKTEAENRARLAAFSDASMGTNNEIARIGERLRRLQLESRGSSGVLPWQMRAGAERGGNWQTGANVANSLSNIGAMYAMGRKPAAGGIGYGAASNPYALGHTSGPY